MGVREDVTDMQAARHGRRRSVDGVDVLARLGPVERVRRVGLPIGCPPVLETLQRRPVRYDHVARWRRRGQDGFGWLGHGASLWSRPHQDETRYASAYPGSGRFIKVCRKTRTSHCVYAVESVGSATYLDETATERSDLDWRGEHRGAGGADRGRGRGRIVVPLARDQIGAVAGPDPRFHRTPG